MKNTEKEVKNTEKASKYAFCETVAAIRWHIRKLSEKGIKVAGGSDTLALCGATPAWDLQTGVEGGVRDLGAELLCRRCVEEWRKVSQ